MGKQEDPWEVDYYEALGGGVPVFEWIDNMPGEEEQPEQGRKPETEKGLALWHIDQLALLGMEASYPLVAHLEGKIWELRWKASGRHHRVAYVAWPGRKFVLLHGFIKKKRTTPKKDLKAARDRLRDYEGRHEG